MKPFDNRVLWETKNDWEAVTGAYKQVHRKALLNLYFKHILPGLGYA
jgi:hypothetical protein